jgi:diguanylate cyclase (GGDEF)-like protein
VQHYKVLVADDCVDEVMILCHGLEMHNYEAVGVHTGLDAVKRCEEGDIDLLLLDIGLPDIDGYEVFRRLKANHKTSNIPVIFVTAKGAPEDIARGYELGAVDYIAKPYNLPIVMLRVDCSMRTKQMMEYAGGQVDYLHDSIYTDQLTGLRNRRFLIERLQEEIEKSHRYKYPVSCLLVDVDEILPEDADLGAASMDDLLAEIALAIRNSSRFYDILARFDGALFAAVLPHAALKDAVSYANKIQEEITSTTFHDPGFPTHAKLSFGIVSCSNGAASGADGILGEAMKNLFKASTKNGIRIVARDLNLEN